MAKKVEPKESQEDSELIKRIDQWLDPKSKASQLKVPTSLDDMKLSPTDETAKPDPAPTEAVKEDEPAVASEAAARPIVAADIDNPDVDKAVHDIEVADSDQILKAEQPVIESSAPADQSSSFSQWLWLIGVIGVIVLAALYLLFLPANSVH